MTLARPYRLGLKRVVPLGRLSWSAMKAKYGSGGVTPPACDYLSELPDDLGMMLNDRYGDCFEAATYHGDQVRTKYATSTMATQPDSDVEALYKCTGWNGVDCGSGTDQGSDPEEVFSWIERNGLPTGPNGTLVKELVASFEINTSDMSSVLEAMDACGGLMVGIIFPSNAAMSPGVWDYDPDATPDGGHEIFAAKLPSPTGNIGFVSWGSPNYAMTPAFWQNQVDQCTACVWRDWAETTGKTPFGMTIPQCQAEMAALNTGYIP